MSVHVCEGVGSEGKGLEEWARTCPQTPGDSSPSHYWILGLISASVYPQWLGAHLASGAGVSQPKTHRPWRRQSCTRMSTRLWASTSTGFLSCFPLIGWSPAHPFSFLVAGFTFVSQVVLGVPKVPSQLCHSGKRPMLLPGLTWAVGRGGESCWWLSNLQNETG